MGRIKKRVFLGWVAGSAHGEGRRGGDVHCDDSFLLPPQGLQCRLDPACSGDRGICLGELSPSSVSSGAHLLTPEAMVNPKAGTSQDLSRSIYTEGAKHVSLLHFNLLP